jgi:ring-1,2-phenylacetyl-CoA epoxidase subunit PaaD
MEAINLSKTDIIQLLETVTDPEIPVLSIKDIGILRSVDFKDNEWQISITPTYSGCPAMQMIQSEIELVLRSNNIESFRIISILDPPWTTDWIDQEAREKLRKFGIAPPREKSKEISCPHCNALDTELMSEFGSTACKALHRCTACGEPFDYFKCH